jgi:hypothetical protein
MDASSKAVAALLRKSGAEIESEVRGSSMVPTLQPGRRVRIRCGPGRFQPGDIVAIIADPTVVHRVVGRSRRGSRSYVITRGDAAPFCDLPVPEEEILGTVIAYDGNGSWQPPSPYVRSGGLRTVFAWLSLRAVTAALHINDQLTALVVRAGGRLAGHRPRV